MQELQLILRVKKYICRIITVNKLVAIIFNDSYFSPCDATSNVGEHGQEWL